MHDKYFIPALYLLAFTGVSIVAYNFYTNLEAEDISGVTLTGGTGSDGVVAESD